MRLSSYFLPTLKELPAEASITSHQLMLRAGMINQLASGIYTWLPLGTRVLQKIEKIIAEEQDRIGCHRVIMSTIQPADIWRQSGRYDDYGKEMLRMKDRHERDLLFSPTNEEAITYVVSQYVKSYRQLPQTLYQIQWKFRDEIRPRFGVMRGREFLMKDGYSFDLDFESAQNTYKKIYKSYLRTFARLGLKALAVKADAGAIGGDMSQEFHIVAQTGESTLYYDAQLDELDLTEISDENIDKISSLYAAAEEKHDSNNCPVPQERLRQARGIEVGHIFYFGTKYSIPLNTCVMGPSGENIPLEMGSYGIGVSRLVGAIIEANHDDNGIIWPLPVSPFPFALINLMTKNEDVRNYCDNLYQNFKNLDIEVLYDDRDERPGTKFADMDLIGLPYQIIIGAKTLESNEIEVKNRRTGEKKFYSQDALMEWAKSVFKS